MGKPIYKKREEIVIKSICIYNLLSSLIMLLVYLFAVLPTLIKFSAIYRIALISLTLIGLILGSLLLFKRSRTGWFLVFAVYLLELFVFQGFYLKAHIIHLAVNLNFSGFLVGLDIPSLALILLMLFGSGWVFEKTAGLEWVRERKGDRI